MKRLKMVLYGEPGVGKSVFASKAPKPFFITTDGNYEWLEEFGAKEEDHKQVQSWAEAKALFSESFDGYETIVIDLTEDLFKWCEYEYCKRNKLEHLSDIGYGKAYDITRNEFFIEICKLIALDKNIILIMHGISFVTKDRRGVEHTKYGPTNRMPDKLLDMIEGRMRYFLRCYLKAEEQSDGTLLKKRYLSLIPKENEFGIARGLDENKVPHDIELDFNLFAEIIGLSTNIKNESQNEKPAEEPQKRERKRKKEQTILTDEEISVEKKDTDDNVKSIESQEKKIEQEEKIESIEEAKEEKVEEKQQESLKDLSSQDDTMARIKAKLAALRNKGE